MSHREVAVTMEGMESGKLHKHSTSCLCLSCFITHKFRATQSEFNNAVNLRRKLWW